MIHEKNSCFIVTITLDKIDQNGIESGSIATLYVPVFAESEESAILKAVVWHSDSGTAIADTNEPDVLAECREISRNLVWKAKRCLRVSRDEMDIFFTLTGGLTTTPYCK